MFNKDKYITSHANETLPLVLQVAMWENINKRRENKVQLDYLQVFELSIENKEGRLIQLIKHSQEQPKKTETYRVECDGFEPIQDKVFVIDDGDYSTMLMASDY